MQIEIWVDVVCPWCYIGDHRLEQALAHMGTDDETRVIYRPFQLDPSAPAEPIPVLDAYAQKFGGADKAAQMVERVSGVAAAEGLEIDFASAKRANTFDAHRTIALAADEGLDTAMTQRLFRAYFVEGHDINDRETLGTLAAEVGLDKDSVVAALATDAKADVVRAGIDRAHEIGIQAVPTFLVDNELMASGALEKHQLVKMLEQAGADARARKTG